MIRRMIKWMFKFGAAIGATVLVAKALEQYRGSPEGVGGESFSFGTDASSIA